jgi:hypothetical protein
VPADEESHPAPAKAGSPVVPAASKAARLTTQELRRAVRSFRAINGGRQWDGVNRDGWLTGLFFFTKDFHDPSRSVSREQEGQPASADNPGVVLEYSVERKQPPGDHGFGLLPGQFVQTRQPNLVQAGLGGRPGVCW